MSKDNKEDDAFERIERTDSRFFDLLLFAFEKINLNPRMAAVMVMSEITHIAVHKESCEVRFYFKSDPEILQQRICETEKSTSILH